VRKKAAFALAVFSVLLFASAITTLSKAADYNKVGVKAGDTAEYSTSISSTNEVSMLIRIISVSAYMVTINVTYNYSTGPTQTDVVYFDVSRGTGFISILTAPGLSVGDPVYLGSSAAIMDIIPMNVTGMTRTVNHYNFSIPGFAYEESYWDRDTGLLVKSSNRNPNFSENITLISTTAFSSVAVLVVVAGVVGALIVIVVVVEVIVRRKMSSKAAA
jgi:hypothetical protein